MSKCKKCDQEIEWVEVPDHKNPGKKMWRPYNPGDGRWHFETCKPMSLSEQMHKLNDNVEPI